MSKSNSSPAGSIGFFGLLTIALIVLKLCHVIDWSVVMDNSTILDTCCRCNSGNSYLGSVCVAF